MSELDVRRRSEIFVGVLAIGLFVIAAQILAAVLWEDWENDVLTPVSIQLELLVLLLPDMGDGGWLNLIVNLPIVVLAYGLASTPALASLLAPAASRQSIVLMMHALLLLCSAVGWWMGWDAFRWGPLQAWRLPLACIGAALAALCLLAHLSWRRNPDGRAAFWYPAALQLWIQSLWLPSPGFEA